jgi:hypothetical protein
MTVSTHPDELERYAMQCTADGRFADAAAAYAEAAQNRSRRAFTTVEQSQVAAHQVLSGVYAAGSRVPNFVRTWATLNGSGRFTNTVLTSFVAATALLAGIGTMTGRPSQNMVAGNSAAFAGAGRFVSKV